MTPPVFDFVRNNRDGYLSQLNELLAIPSISTQSQHNPDVRHAAEWLVNYLKSAGLTNITIFETAKHPLVYADWLQAGPNSPTILIYGHYDVQPADPLNLWQSPPFEPTIRDNNLYARGATDDKGQLFTHLAAIDALLKTDGKLPVNVKLLIEGEEEIGSIHLNSFIQSHKELLAADCAVISDTGFAGLEQPTLVYGLRGLAQFELEVRAAKQDLHSGMYGGVVHNPLLVLARIIAALHDDNAHITIPGYYDDVLPLNEEERGLLAQMPNTFIQESGAIALWGEPGFTPREQVGARPTVEVNGIVGGYTGEGHKTVIPAVATAKITCRLVPNQDPLKIGEAFEKYVQQLAPHTVTVTLKRQEYSAAVVVNYHDPAILAAVTAYRKVFGKTPLFAREGGSIPVVLYLQQALNIPTAMMGFGLPDDNLHAPNEKFYLPNFYRGIEAAIIFMQEYARLKTA